MIYNENRLRWAFHEVKDYVGELNTINGPGDVSVGIGQMKLSTALFLDLGFTASDGQSFDQAKEKLLAATTLSVRWDYMARLKDPARAIDYIARLLAYLKAAGLQTPEEILDAYNNNTWFETPSAYGQRFGDIVDLLDEAGVTFSSGNQIIGPGGVVQTPE